MDARSQAGGEAGFTLIEALVALAILAMSAVALLSATEAHVARIGDLEARALAQLAAENHLAEIELGLAEDAAEPDPARPDVPRHRGPGAHGRPRPGADHPERGPTRPARRCSAATSASSPRGAGP